MKLTRLSLLSLALSILVLSTTLSTSASLTDTKATTSSFIVDAEGVFGISLNANEYHDLTVIPGESINLAPTVTNDSSIPVYLFAEITVPSDFEIDGDLPGWTLFTPTVQDPDDPPLYYYGSNGSLSSLASGDDIKLFDTITLSDSFVAPVNEEDPISYDFAMLVHAIQTAGYENQTIDQVWDAAR